ncbi:hypothetical protein ABFX02_12G133600 [Erythranthe guttata]
MQPQGHQSQLRRHIPQPQRQQMQRRNNHEQLRQQQLPRWHQVRLRRHIHQPPQQQLQRRNHHQIWLRPIFRAYFDPPGSSRTVKIGNIQPRVTIPAIQTLLSNHIGRIEGFYRKTKLSHCFVTFVDRQSAIRAVSLLDGLYFEGRWITVEWAPPSARRNENSSCYNIYIGGCGHTVDDDILSAWLSRYPSFIRAQVVRYGESGSSRGFAYATFSESKDAQKAINEIDGKVYKQQTLECCWDAKSADVAPEDDLNNTTVFVSQFPPRRVTEDNLSYHFSSFGIGKIECVRLTESGRYGFVRYSTHAEAADAIRAINNSMFLNIRAIKCEWADWQLL